MWLTVVTQELLQSCEFPGRVAYMMGVQFESDTIEKWQKDPEKRLLAEKQRSQKLRNIGPLVKPDYPSAPPTKYPSF